MSDEEDEFATLLGEQKCDHEAEQLLWTQVKHMVTPLKVREKMRGDASTAKLSIRSLIDNYHYEPMQFSAAHRSLDSLHEDVERKITKGRIVIEQTIDLHDMKREDAHRRLFMSLHNAYREKMRTVLVITGKGRAGEGVLKQSLPLWLASESFEDIVSSYAPSALQHGGTGAFYVRLRRQL